MQYGGLRSSATTASHLRRIEPINDWIKSCAQVCHAAFVVFPMDVDGGEHVYRVYPINVKLVTHPVIMPVNEEHGCDSGLERLDKSFTVAERAER